MCIFCDSTFSDINEVIRFIHWYNEDGQIHSEWDKYRYKEALYLVGPTVAKTLTKEIKDN